MKRFVSRNWILIAVFTVVVLPVGALILVCWHYQVWSLRDWEIYKQMERECHPVWRDLHYGKVHVGQPLEEVKLRTKPLLTENYGMYVVLHYQQGLCFTGVSVTAKEGRLVAAQAWSCTWNRTFFDVMTPQDNKVLNDAYKAHWEAIRNQRELGDQQ